MNDEQQMEEFKQKLVQELATGMVASAVATQSAFAKVADFILSDTFRAFIKKVQAVPTYMAEHSAEVEKFVKENLKDFFLLDSILSLTPYIQTELEAVKTNPEFAGCTVSDIIEQGIDANFQLTDSKFKPLIERAIQQLVKNNTASETAQTTKELPRIIAKQADKIDFPLDKANSKIWSLISAADPDGKRSLAIDTSKKGSKQEALILYDLDWDNLPAGVQITKELTPFDKRVYIAAAALFNAGNTVFTATQLYKMMGNSSLPPARDLQKVNDSLTKMRAALVHIDNTHETQHSKYPLFKYDAPLLPFERVSAHINGRLTDSAIHLFREPPLITFARDRNQLTTLPRQLLESPISKTEANMRLEDYLLQRIGHMKSGKGNAPRKMLLSTIYEKCGITSAKQKQRTPEKIKAFLDHYKECKLIKGYTFGADGITIELENTNKK